MSDFRIAVLPQSSVLYLYSMRDSILLDPDYQRLGDIWTMEKKQLLVDSIINGFDIPKIYFHEFVPAREISGRTYKYAIVDGKQRLQSIWGFIDGDFALSDDFKLLDDEQALAEGLTYREFAGKFPLLKVKFDGTSLSVVTIQTDDVELIEEMFSRLNEAVPLSAAEKRNAFGGAIPPRIRALCAMPFFRDKLPFPNSRYRHYDLAAKFLYIEQRKAIVDTKKAYLDQFVKNFRDKGEDEAERLLLTTQEIVTRMAEVFVNNDPLLRSIGMVVLYYLLFTDLTDGTPILDRHSFERFEDLRRANRQAAEKDIAGADYDLLEFDRLAQAPNDKLAIEFRFNVLRLHAGALA